MNGWLIDCLIDMVFYQSFPRNHCVLSTLVMQLSVILCPVILSIRLHNSQFSVNVGNMHEGG